MKIIFHLFLFILLTVLTQIGGLIWLLNRVITARLKLSRRRSFFLFVVVYILASLVFIPLMAPFFGREALPLRGSLRPLNIITCLANRHYVNQSVKDQLLRASEELNKVYPESAINYLDGNFPFFDGFPLLPHLSHNDGKKVDIAFLYRDSNSGEPSNTTPSFIGYGIYDSPKSNEVNYPSICRMKGFWQYGALTYITPKWNEHDFEVDAERTAYLIKVLANNNGSKIFIEPHLKQRWNLHNLNNIRFHGCQAVRHDDHIHYQVK